MNLDPITFQRKSHEDFNEKINFRFTLKLSEIMQVSAFIISLENQKLASKLRIPQLAEKFGN